MNFENVPRAQAAHISWPIPIHFTIEGCTLSPNKIMLATVALIGCLLLGLGEQRGRCDTEHCSEECLRTEHTGEWLMSGLSGC